MRIILFFDLPTVTKREVRAYTRFRRELIKLGFFMQQMEQFQVPQKADIEKMT